jgi:NADH-quinone oxidoreductase subunit L
VNPAHRVSCAIGSFFEPKLFDAMLVHTARCSALYAAYLQKIQSGQIRSYVAWMAAGIAVVLIYLAL